MRAFLILCSVISAAYAASLGYNYESNSGPALDGGLSGGQNGGSSYGGPSYGRSSLSGPSYSGLSSSGPSYSGPSSSGPSYSGPSSSGTSYNAPAEFNKEYFTYTAPENEFNDAGNNDQLANSLKKNLRVIFIKGPENSGLENAALQLAKSVGEDRTAIYVLNKQADIGDLANKLQSLNHQNANKPEVHFVKYRTPADAENAQHAIQSQYDGLGGPSSSHNGGVAPVLNFASKSYAPVAQQQDSGAPISSIGSSYLPPNKRV